LLAEPEAAVIRGVLAEHDAWRSSEPLVVELRRLAARQDLESEAEEYLEAFRLVAIDSASLQRASRLEPMVVRSLDAIHLEAAVQLRDSGEVNWRRDVRPAAQCRMCASRPRRARAGAELADGGA
jgi:uncharacterized protein